jgi:ABC-type amino acid transport system permease subunit
MRFLGQAVLNTLLASVMGCSIGFALRIVPATARLPHVMPVTPLRAAAILWTAAFRHIPILVLLVFLVSQALRVDAPLWAIAVTAVAIRMSALAAENARAGDASVRPQPWKAARMMTIAPLPAPRRVILTPSIVRKLRAGVAGLTHRRPRDHLRREGADPARPQRHGR